MPFRLIWETSGVHLVFTGLVTGDEIKEAGDRIYGHHGFDSLRYQIFDFTEADDFRLSLDQMKEIAAIDSIAAHTNPRIRQAIVSTSETINVALAVYEQNQPDLPWESQGFETLEEARHWLTT